MERLLAIRFIISAFAIAIALSALAVAQTTAGSVHERTQTARPPMSVDDVGSFLDQFVPAQLNRSGIPGAVVVVVKDDTIVAAKGYGLADLEANRPMTPGQTRVNIASVKKLFEGLAIMQMVEQGRLDLDENVNVYLDFAIPTPDDGVPVTLRRLMTHRAGFEDWFKNSSRSFAERLPPRLYPFGDVPAYSNYGAALTGHIVARQSGEPLGAYVTDHLLFPLGMTSSTFASTMPADSRTPNSAQGSTMAKGYQVVPGLPPTRLDEEFVDLQLDATGADMGRFMRAVLDGGAIEGRRILRAETLATMMAPQVTEPLSVMGLNFYQRNVGGVAFIGHRGDTSTFQVDLLLQPQARFGIFIAYNAEADDSQRDELERALVDRYFAAPPKTPSSFVPRPADAVAVAGWYEHTRRSETNLFSIEELFSQVRVKANSDGSIIAGTASLLDLDSRWTERREIGPLIFEASDGDLWAFAEKHRGLMVRETTDGTSGRVRVAWYKTAYFVQPLVLATLVIMAVGLLARPSAVLVRSAAFANPSRRSDRYATAFVRGTLVLHLAVAASVTLLIKADYEKKQIFKDALDPWLVGLYVAAWLGVFAVPLVGLIAYRSWQTPDVNAGLRLYLTAIALATLVAAWFAVAWHVAGTTVSY